MGFGGSVAAMISSLKMNSRGKRKTYFDKDKLKDKNNSEPSKPVYKQATPEQIEQIRVNLKKENKRIFIKKLILISIYLAIVIALLVYFF